ncbi:hypothetical protein HY212_06045 [Candidatus Pacearchaeota archaeon]|nr:hypothetical protein [Candidatus Pacearchaeota archaeon]
MGRTNYYDSKGHYTGHSDTKQKDTWDQLSDNHCFVATAVYEDINAQPLDVLRHYRDNVLMNNPVGKTFVDFYYSGVGEAIAGFISTKARFAIPLLRRGLNRLVERHSTSLQAGAR